MENIKKSGSLQALKNLITHNRKGETRLYLFLAFLLPFLIIWAIFIIKEVHPFGDQQILVTDLWHQYFPFFKEEQSKLQSGESLLYSWNTGLGTNFISVMSYYAASPLNILSVLFPLENSRDALTLFLTIKIGCSGLFFAIFLKHIFGRNDITITGFGLFYALCNYMMGYYWNLIWMDTFALLPLVVLGTVMLVKEGRYKLYIISLALSLIANFYIGLFTCIFTAMIFLGAVIVNWKSFKNSFLRLGQITGATVIALGLGAFMLIPAYFALMLTHSADNTFPEFINFYEEWFTMLSNMIGYHEPTAKEGLPNFYCGMFAIILFGVFLVNRKIKIREKIITLVYLAFIVVSCNMNLLNFMWHGFHFTNMLPYRFSFLFSFLLAAAAYRAFTVMTEDIKLFDILSMAAMTCIVYLISYRDQSQKAVLLSIGTCAVYIAVMFVYERKLINKKIMQIAIAVVCTAEMGWNAYIGVTTVTTTKYSIYPSDYEEVSKLLGMRDDTQKDFFRTEFSKTYTINDPALYGVKGVSQFSSTANVNVTRFLDKLGLDASPGSNRYCYADNTPIINSLLNIRYIITRDGNIGNETYLDEVYGFSLRKLYENNALLPLAFTADSGVMDYTGENEDPIQNQNELLKRICGTDEDFFFELPVKDVGHKGLNVIKTSENHYNYQYDKPSDGSDECYVKYNYIVERQGSVFAVFKFANTEEFSVKRSETSSRTFGNMKYKSSKAIGTYTAGEKISIISDVEKEKNGSGEIYVYQVNESAFRNAVEKLSKGGVDISSYDQTSINGKFTAENDGVLYTSIPYDGGWKAYIDGEETEITPLKDAFNCIPVKKGEHTIEMKYCPPGFVTGVIISICSLILFAAVWIAEKKLFKKVPSGVLTEQAEQSGQPEQNEPIQQIEQPEQAEAAEQSEHNDVISDTERPAEETYENTGGEDNA